MDLYEMNLARLRKLRAEYIGHYKNRTGLPTRRDARMWALFYSGLIRKVEHARSA